MSISEKCSCYRQSNNPTIGMGLGYCDLDGDQTICDGDIKFCKNLDALRKRFLDQKSQEGSNNQGEEGQNKKPLNYKVLVVDDEEPMRKLMFSLLSKVGHQCITASNGIEALNQICQNKFDAVITDIVMPEKDGIALTKEILSLYPNLPIMVMTGFSKEYSTESAMAAGARDFIKKPFSIDEFILRFNKMMHDHKIFCQIEDKKNELVFHMHKTSLEEIERLKSVIESLKSK